MNQYSADRPIHSIDSDVLGRSEYARRLSKGIVKLPLDTGFVFGLSGKWGAGKSSTIEMTLEWIEFHEMFERNINSDFLENGSSPWNEKQMMSLSRLYRKSFSTLDSAYGDNTKSAMLTARWHLLKNISNRNNQTEFSDEDILRYFFLKHAVKEKPKTIPVKFSPWLIPKKAKLAQSFISDLFVVISRYLGGDVGKAAQEYIQQILILIDAGADALGQSYLQKLTAIISDAFQPRSKTLDELKEYLERRLRELGNKRILIIIDDLDRMTPKEAVQMVGLIKSLGDLPNITYLLSYDSGVVGKQLETVLGLGAGQGQVYLEKIVQLSFELDQPKQTKLYRVFSATLKKMAPKAYDEIANNIESAWFYVLADFVQSPRDVNRIVSKYVFLYETLSESTDPADLLILTVADVMDKTLYLWILRNQSLLNLDTTDRRDWISDRPSQAEQNKLSKFERINNQSSSKLPITSQQKHLLNYLFPDLFTNDGMLGFSKEPRLHAIANPDYTASYFQFFENTEGWPRSLLNEINSNNDYEVSIRKIISYVDSQPIVIRPDLRISILDEMLKWSINETFDYIKWLKGILKYAPYFVEAQDEVNWRNNLNRLYLLITNIGRDNPNFQSEEFFYVVLDERYDFSLPSAILWRLIGSSNPQSEYKTQYPQVKDREVYRQRFISRCFALTKSGQLFNQIDTSQILTAWWAINSDGLDKTYFHNLIDNNKHPEVFFELQVIRSSAGDYIKIENSKEILSTQKTYDLAIRIQGDNKLPNSTRAAAKTYIERYERGQDEDNF